MKATFTDSELAMAEALGLDLDLLREHLPDAIPRRRTAEQREWALERRRLGGLPGREYPA